MTQYDCTEDVRQHIAKVRYWLHGFSQLLESRGRTHDASKLLTPEKECFDKWTPELKTRVFGSDEYKQALVEMGEGLKHHYAGNRHHPEHWPNGINDMSLHDVVEMVCDWMAACEARRVPVDLVAAQKRFGISDQLIDIIANTLAEEDFWNTTNGVPVVNFCPGTHKRDLTGRV